MTICIAAICENGKYVIVMADRMITYTAPPFHQFEHPVPKIHKLSNNAVLMTAGSALLPSELIYKIKKILRSGSVENSDSDYSFSSNMLSNYIKIKDILDIIKKAYLLLRKQIIEERFLQKYDLKWEDYVNFIKGVSTSEKGLIPFPAPSIKIFAEIEEFQLELQAILAGVDDEGAHIYVVEDPGVLNNFNDIGYAAIGSGNYHAMRSFIENSYSTAMPLWRALYIVYEAKKYAESAPGVGTQTDAMIISKDKIKILDSNDINQLEKIYKEKQENLIKINNDIYEKYEQILKGIAKNDRTN